MNSLKTAVLFIVFNRPETTTKVFEKIRQAKPPRLYVASDGPREKHESDKENVKKTLEIATKVDWPCELKTLIRDKNQGCKKGVSTAITWFFENEAQGIILEDDCVPNSDFFIFCENLLNRYADEERVSAITGNNFQNDNWRGDASYYFSKYNHCWGWASWKRAWKHYQEDLLFWPEWKKSSNWSKYIADKVEQKYWENIYDKMYANEIDTWDYPWMASTWYKNGLTVTPNVNLVSNIGFGPNSTHTKDKSSSSSNMPTKEIGDLIHPKLVQRNLKADRWTFNNHFGGKYLRFPYNLIIFPYRFVGNIISTLLKKIIIKNI
jgi:hypothetical protein